MFRKKIFYIHGLSSNKDNNPILKQQAMDKKYKFYSINLPGHGDNEFNDIALTIEGYGEYIKDYLLKNKIKKRLTLYGHSMGGAIAVYIAAKYQKELDIKQIILEDPLNLASERNIKNFNLEAITRKLEQVKVINQTRENGTTHHLLAWINKLKSRIPPHRLYNFITLTKNISSNKSLQRLDQYYKELNVHTYAIFGENDFIIQTYESIQYFNEINNLIETFTIPDAAHSPYKENPEIYKETLSKIL